MRCFVSVPRAIKISVDQLPFFSDFPEHIFTRLNVSFLQIFPTINKNGH